MTSLPADGSGRSGLVAVITCAPPQDAVGEDIIAQLLLNHVAKVYVLAKTRDDFTAITEELVIRQGVVADSHRDDDDTNAAADALSLDFVPCDLGSVQSASEAAQALLRSLMQQQQRLDLLFCNASSVPATPSVQDRDRTPGQRIDPSFATDYLGHFVLVNVLLPLIEQTASAFQQARVVVSTSYLYAVAQDVSVESITLRSSAAGSSDDIPPSSYAALSRYSSAQLAKILFTRYLAKLEHAKKGLAVYANCFDATNIQPDLLSSGGSDVTASLPPAILRSNGRSPEDAATTAVFLGTDDTVPTGGISGQYFGSPDAETPLDGVALDDDLMNNLWYWSGHHVTEILGKGWEEVGTGIMAEYASEGGGEA